MEECDISINSNDKIYNGGNIYGAIDKHRDNNFDSWLRC